MDPEGQKRHRTSTWERVRPQHTKGWVYLILGLLAIVLLIGSMCLYVVAAFGDPDAGRTGLRHGLELANFWIM